MTAPRARGSQEATRTPTDGPAASARERIAQTFTRVEDAVYVGLGALLAASATALLVGGALEFGRSVMAGDLGTTIIALLDRVLLILMIVEILYTVQVSFREHVLAPEPFLIVGLIAAIRRVLILTAEFSRLMEQGEQVFRNAMIELGLLTLMILALVGSLLMLRRRGGAATADRL